MTRKGGYTPEKIAQRAAKRNRSFEEQYALDTRNSAQKTRDHKKRDYIEPKAAKPKAVKTAANTGGKKGKK